MPPQLLTASDRRIAILRTHPVPLAPAGVGGRADIGAQVFSSNCSSCHGTRGEGGIGPTLSGGVVVAHYPNVEDQNAVVTNAEGSMPAWRGRLTPAQIQAVVDYTRTVSTPPVGRSASALVGMRPPLGKPARQLVNDTKREGGAGSDGRPSTPPSSKR